jgi:hypothetical protein
MMKRPELLVTVPHDGLRLNPVKKRLIDPVVKYRAPATGVIRVRRQRLNLDRLHVGRASPGSVRDHLEPHLGGRKHASLLALGAEKS